MHSECNQQQVSMIMMHHIDKELSMLVAMRAWLAATSLATMEQSAIRCCMWFAKLYPAILYFDISIGFDLSINLLRLDLNQLKRSLNKTKLYRRIEPITAN